MIHNLFKFGKYSSGSSSVLLVGLRELILGQKALPLGLVYQAQVRSRGCSAHVGELREEAIQLTPGGESGGCRFVLRMHPPTPSS